MSVLDGRAVRYAATERGYVVTAAGGAGDVPLGEVERTRVSTDTKIGRLRRPGKGRTAWRAVISHEDARSVGGRGARELVFYSHGGMTLRVERFGRSFDKRSEAVEALVAWADHPEQRSGPGGTLMFDILTQDALTLDAAASRVVEDERGVARVHAQMVLLQSLPDGFRIERTRADVSVPRDPGLELTLIDERDESWRVLGKVSRRLIGKQKITWTPAQLCDPDAAVAFAVALRFAAHDAERG